MRRKQRRAEMKIASAWKKAVLAAVLTAGLGMSLCAQERGPVTLTADKGPVTIGFSGWELVSPGKTVKGAPFTAQVTVESEVQLADGNTINRKTTSTVTRDSQGRVRRDQNVVLIIPEPNSGGISAQMISIDDPVAGVHYLLNRAKKTGARTPWEPDSEKRIEAKRREGRGGGSEESPQLQKENLGGQTIEGVYVTGTRVTRTIPVGAIGNAKPIAVITEQWYSPDLQVFVLSKHSDPRTGTTSAQLSKINRAEPDGSLFVVPADYSIQATEEGKPVIKVKEF
jgi:hypothetical protein